MNTTPNSSNSFPNTIVGIITLIVVFITLVKSCSNHQTTIKQLQLNSTEAIIRETHERFFDWIPRLSNASSQVVATAIVTIRDISLEEEELRQQGRTALFENLAKSSLKTFEECASSIDSTSQLPITNSTVVQENFIALLKLDNLIGIQTSLEGFNLCGITINDFQFSDVKILESQLARLSLNHVNAQNISFKNSYLQEIIVSNESYFNEIDFSEATIESANFTDLSISNAQFIETNLNGFDFNRLSVQQALFYNTEAKNGTLKESSFENTSFDDSKWIDTSFIGIRFINTSLCDMQLIQSNLRDISIIGNSTGRGLKFKKTQVWHLFVDSQVDMSGSEFSGDFEHLRMEGVFLLDSIFDNVNMYGAILNNSNLKRSKFSNRCTMKNANLENADLTDVDFGDTDLSNAQLRGADLRGAILSNALNLNDAIWKGALIDRRTVIPDYFNPSKHGIKILD